MRLMTAALMASALVASSSLVSASASARMLDPAVPADALEMSKRIQCGEADGKPAVYHWTGKVYGRTEGEPDKLLFGGEGMNIRSCMAVDDPVRGRGWRLVSREIMLFLDPKSGEVLRRWDNPWSGETVDVVHIANDPVNQRPSFAVDAAGKPVPTSFRRAGPWMFMAIEVPLFYENPLAGAYQDYVGGKYHAMEIFDFAVPAAELLDAKRGTAYPAVSWVRLSDWLPWMKMRGRSGQLVFNAVGAKLKSYDQLPALLKNEIATSYPSYTAAPPSDDARPNQTTWTVFKARVDAERAAKAK